MSIVELTDMECERLGEIQKSNMKLSGDEICGLSMAMDEGMKFDTYIKKVFEERKKLEPEPEPEPAPQTQAEPEPEN